MADSDSPPPPHVNFLFRVAIGVGAVFVITIFAYVSLLFGDTRSPAARFLNAHAGRIFLTEVGVLIVVGVAAMLVDRRQTARHRGRAVASNREAASVELERKSVDAPASEGTRDASE